jgi:dephospho-CoA kinase
MNRVIGVTGGVGSGKSTVLSFLKKNFDAEIFMADDVGHEVFVRGSDSFDRIVDHFGSEILDEDGEISRRALAECIFHNEKEKVFLDGIVHPYVIDRIRESIDDWRIRIDDLDPADSEIHLFVLETALMFETGCDRFCEEVWGVFADAGQRIERLSSSRGYSEEKSRSIFSSQLSDEILRERCDRIVQNDSSPEELEALVCRMVRGR